MRNRREFLGGVGAAVAGLLLPGISLARGWRRQRCPTCCPTPCRCPTYNCNLLCPNRYLGQVNGMYQYMCICCPDGPPGAKVLCSNPCSLHRDCTDTTDCVPTGYYGCGAYNQNVMLRGIHWHPDNKQYNPVDFDKTDLDATPVGTSAQKGSGNADEKIPLFFNDTASSPSRIRHAKLFGIEDTADPTGDPYLQIGFETKTPGPGETEYVLSDPRPSNNYWRIICPKGATQPTYVVVIGP